jgi:Na+/proline symporter
MSDFTMYGSLFLIGTALALAGGAGLFLPPGSRAGVALALLAGAGVGIAGLALGSPSFADGDPEDWWRIFFVSSIVGFVTVAAGLMVAWRRGRPQPAP